MDSIREAKVQSYPWTNMNVVHCTNRERLQKDLYTMTCFEQSEGEASFVLSLSDLLKTFHSSFCRSSKQSEFSPKRIVEKFSTRGWMDSTAQWFYVSVLGGQKLGHCFWTEFVTFKTCKIWWSSGLLNIDVGLLGKYFLSDIRPLCCKDLVVFLFFLAESSKYSCKLFSSCCLLLSYWYIYSSRKPIIDLITPIFFSGTVFL